MQSLDPYRRPPDQIRSFYKHYQKLSIKERHEDPELLDFEKESIGSFRVVKTIDISDLHLPGSLSQDDTSSTLSQSAYIYESKALPGLHIIPSLVSECVQYQLLDRLLHRDLANEQHHTNLHMHYNVPYRIAETSHIPTSASTYAVKSFFHAVRGSNETFDPLDSSVHKPLSINQVLEKKLRWITLGGQYDWTNKRYPKEQAPKFPEDVAGLIRQAFPYMTPEAAIVNIYSPGDTLSLHRDISEECSEGLVSISIGCDAIFIVGLESKSSEDPRHVAIRLRSGDAVYMSGPSRVAWHGVPNILAQTCPKTIREWPCQITHKGVLNPKTFESWRGWMENKRINLNVRQMKP